MNRPGRFRGFGSALRNAFGPPYDTEQDQQPHPAPPPDPPVGPLEAASRVSASANYLKSVATKVVEATAKTDERRDDAFTVAMRRLSEKIGHV